MNEKFSLAPFFLAGMILLLRLAAPPDSRASSGDAAKGREIFASRCTVCHTIGGGEKIGPDLKGVAGSRSETWLKKFISNPDHLIKSGDPEANRLLKEFKGLEMPTLGLSPAQVGDVIAYFKSSVPPSRAQAPPPAPPSVAAAPAPAPLAPAQTPVRGPRPARPPAPPAAALPPGSAEAGQRLFVGSIPFQKGGPPCASCHDAAVLPFPGGGTLGPDLTGAFAKLGAKGMKSILGTLSSPTMKPVFHGRALTPQEKDDLEAFLQNAGVRSLIGRTMQIGLSALGGLLILVLAVWLFGRNRPGTGPGSPVERSAGEGGAER
jgi:mono/diheme cytochrome c family protein